jgi:hypothetical protein
MNKAYYSILLFLGYSIFIIPFGFGKDLVSTRTEDYIFEISKTLPKMTFKVLVVDGEIKKITVYQEGKAQPLQSLTDLDPNLECESLGTFSYSVEDINFDGYLDFKFSCWRGVTGNEGFRYLIYDKNQKRFRYTGQFIDFSNIKADQNKKEITTFRKEGSAGMIYVAETYKWLNRKLTLMERETQQPIEEDGNKFQRIKEKRVGGHMVIVEREIIQ